jgi:hypothetical protein
MNDIIVCAALVNGNGECAGVTNSGTQYFACDCKQGFYWDAKSHNCKGVCAYPVMRKGTVLVTR